MDSELFKKMEEDLEFFKALEKEDSESMTEDYEYIKTSLHELRERVEKLEQEVDHLQLFDNLSDQIDKNVIEQIAHLTQCIKKQKVWNDLMQEKTDILHKLIELETGGQK